MDIRNKLLMGVAVVAITIFAIGGTNQALAGDVVVAPDGAGGADDIVDGTVDTADLADGSVTSAKIVDGTVATVDLADDSVTSAKIAADTITAADIAADAVTAAELADNAVDTAAIADGAVTAAKLDASLQSSITATSSNTSRIKNLENDMKDVEAGVAMSMAMSSTMAVPGKKFSVSMGAGQFKDETALASRLSYKPTDNVVISAGVGYANEEFGSTIGVSYGW